jgi:hypothetical protein
MATGAHNGSLAAPPPPFRQTSPQIIELREGGGWVAIVGLPFVLAGVVMALTVAGLLHIEVEPTGKWTPLVLAGLSVAFIAGGAVMLFGRRWLTIDASRECIVRSYGLLVPLHTRERSLSEFNAVVIVHQAGDSDSGERYPVRLRSITGRDFVVSNPTEFGPSRSQAEYLSFFLRLPLVDTTTDHDTVIAPERAGQGLRERLLSGAAEAQPSRPAKMRCEVTESPGQTTIVVPGGGSWPVGVLSVVFPLVILLFVLPAFLRFFTRGAPQIVQYGFLLILVAVFIVPTIVASVNLMVGSKRKRATVTASAAGLEIVTRSGWRTRTTQIAGADLLDLDCSTADAALRSARNRSVNRPEVPNPEATRVAQFAKRWVPSSGIVVKSRQELISFGEGLPAGELQYLRSILRKALAGR